MAENIDVNVNVNTSQANRNLDNLNNRIGALQKSFGALKTAIGGIAFGSLISNSLRFAAGMVDVANSTDIALEAVVGFSRAVQDNGGSLQDAEKALQQFNVRIGEAAQGSATVQEAFDRVGVSLEDLRTLSQEDLLRKVVQGLSQIQDASTRAKLANDLLGQSFRKLDIKGIANELDTAISSSVAYTEAIRTADEVQGNLEKAVTDLQIALLAVLEPVGDLAKSISTNIDAIVKWTTVIFEFVKVFAAFFIIGRVLGLILKFANGIRLLITGLSGAKDAFGKVTKEIGGSGLIYLFTNLGKVVGKLKDLMKLGSFEAFRFSNRLVKIIEGAKSAAFAVAGLALSFLGLDKALAKLEEYKEDFSKPLVITGGEAQAMPEGFFEKRREQIRKIEVALQKEKLAIREVTAAYQRANAEQLANINIQRLSLDMSKDEVEVMNAVAEVIKRNEEAIRKLQDQRESLASDSKLIPVIDQEIKKLQESLETDKRVTAEAMRGLQARVLEQEKLNLALEQTRQKLTDTQTLDNLNQQLATIGQYGDELENNLLILQVTQELQSKLTDLAVRQMELENQRMQLGEARFQQEMAHLEALRNAAYEYAGARLEAEQKILEAQRATQENAQAGVERAMDDISKQFEPYTMAQDAVKQGWNRVSSAIDDFIETGKFNFKDFARSVLADLAKMIAKALVFKAIQGALGMFGLSLPGLANGGPAKQNQPYIVGEKGPELFVPNENGTVIPNNKLPDILKQMSDKMFGGTRAQGGPVQANEFYITGEKGPELFVPRTNNTVQNNKLASMEGKGEISAPVTNNYITNNINAVDAKSVAQLFAENRKTLLGAVATAQREMPYMA